jgi:predicted metal-dependent hydrolase
MFLSWSRLKGRWGSCDQDKNIVLNLFLMQLPWQLIDYVLLHELCHTMHLDHGPGFWQTFLMHKPTAKDLRREIRHYQPNFVLLVP